VGFVVRFGSNSEVCLQLAQCLDIDLCFPFGDFYVFIRISQLLIVSGWLWVFTAIRRLVKLEEFQRTILGKGMKFQTEFFVVCKFVSGVLSREACTCFIVVVGRGP
jgi:hypothetical protein